MPPNDPPAPPKPPTADPAAGKSVPSPAGAKVAPSVRPPTLAPRPPTLAPRPITGLPKPPPVPGAPKPAGAPPPLPPAAPQAAPATNVLPSVPGPPKLPSIPAPPAIASSASSAPSAPRPPVPATASAPPPANTATNVSPSVPPKTPSIPAPPPTISVEEKSVDFDLAAIGLGDAAERARLANFSDETSGTNRKSVPDEPAPRSRRIGETDIPPPAHVDTERAPGSKDPYIGTTFDHRYRIEKLLGEGGMGFVYLARHKVIDKKVAIKVLRAEMAKDREILERFLQEARAASSIGNPHIIDISDFGDLPDGSTYFVMEFLDGQSLVQFNDKTNRQPFDVIAKIAIQMANGLAAAHEAGIIHRDLKPENIFIVTRGLDKHFVKILDFGIAKVATSGENKLTRAGAVFGTPHYMSPEQAAGSPLDHRTDIYSLGVMLYEMVSGVLPFTADNFMGILSQHMYQAPPPLGKLNLEPLCPSELEAIIFKCLSKVPDDRYPDMAALSADLQRFQDGHVPDAVAEMASRPEGLSVGVTPDKPKKAPWLRLVAVGAIVMGATLGTVLVIGQGPTGNNTPGTANSAVAPPTSNRVTATAKTKVVVIVEPLSAVATAKFAGKTIKFPEDKVEVEPGKPVTLEVEAAGFETQKVTLDGKTEVVRVKLVGIGGAGVGTAPPETPTGRPTSTKAGSSGSPTTTTTTTTKPPGGSDVVDLYGPTQSPKPKPTP
jgi:eukaryotic-like serine/threonine-protein kinase